MKKWIPQEDETIWRVNDLIASGSSDSVYKTQFWKPIHSTGFNVFKTEKEAKELDLELLNIKKQLRLFEAELGASLEKSFMLTKKDEVK